MICLQPLHSHQFNHAHIRCCKSMYVCMLHDSLFRIPSHWLCCRIHCLSWNTAKTRVYYPISVELQHFVTGLYHIYFLALLQRTKKQKQKIMSKMYCSLKILLVNCVPPPVSMVTFRHL